MIKLQRGFYIHFTVPLIFLISFLSGTFLITAMAFLTSVCHELCHLATALMLKEKLRGIAIMPYGCRLYMGRSNSPAKEFAIAASGPVFNIIMALVIRKGPLHEINLAMAAINLFPIMPLDGGRIVNVFLSLCVGNFKSVSLMKRVSLIGGIILTGLGIAQAALTGFNLSVFTIGAFLLFSAITENGKESFFAKTLEDRGKLMRGTKKGVLLVAKENIPARKILPEIPPGKYALIKVVDESGNIKCELSEDKLKEKIISCGAGIRLREIT